MSLRKKCLLVVLISRFNPDCSMLMVVGAPNVQRAVLQVVLKNLESQNPPHRLHSSKLKPARARVCFWEPAQASCCRSIYPSGSLPDWALQLKSKKPRQEGPLHRPTSKDSGAAPVNLDDPKVYPPTFFHFLDRLCFGAHIRSRCLPT